MTYPCPNCNRDEGSPICLGDERCERTPTEIELTHVVTWRYSDNSAFGVVSVHRTLGGAERMVALLKTHAETKRFDIESVPAERP